MKPSLGLADVALVTLRAGFEGLVVPGKLLGYMAWGIPTIYVGPPGDVHAFLKDSAGGIRVENGDATKLAEHLIEMAETPSNLEVMGASAIAYYRYNLAREIALAYYLELIRRITRKENSLIKA